MSAQSSTRQWRIWIDTGGTFTDCLARDPDGVLRRAKVLSSAALRGRIVRAIDAQRLLVEQNWNACDDLIAGFVVQLLGRNDVLGCVRSFDAHASIIELTDPIGCEVPLGAAFQVRGNEPAPVLAARIVTATPAGQPLPSIAMRLATTRGTNALLERNGQPTALFITEGFGDLLLIGDQQRPELFALKVEKPPPLHAETIEVRERLAADGSVLRPIDVDHVRAEARRLAAKGIQAAAVALMHSYLNPDHERCVAAVLREEGFAHVSCSSALAPLIRVLPRTQTAVVNAYLSPIVQFYLEQIGARMYDDAGSSLHVMTSAAGLVRAERYRACDSLLSGPAGGVAGAAAAGRLSGFSKVIGFDMGGTSTDVSRFDEDFDYRFEHAVGDVRLLAPALAIETVAAGGGSICDCINGQLTVGPRSAGADPGPACYGVGGPLTLTDVNLLLGRLDESQFEVPISRERAEAALAALLHRVAEQTGARPQPDALLAGLLDIANERMAAAIETISVRQGYDPAEYALVAFGGAGGQHACAIAQRLGITTIIMPAEASMLSALGLGAAAIERFAQRQVLRLLRECAPTLIEDFFELEREAVAAVAAEGVDRMRVIIRRRIVNLRLLGQDASLPIEIESLEGMRGDGGGAAVGLVNQLTDSFLKQYANVYGHAPMVERKPIEVESVRVVASEQVADVGCSAMPPEPFAARAVSSTVAWFDGHRRAVPRFDRSELAAGAMIDGPAIVFDRRSAFVIESGWRAVMDAAGALVLRRSDAETAGVQHASQQPELVKLELFTNRFASIASSMGQMLQRTALSTNVKERMDFSCAVLDANGELVVNAPHIPVHLGALGMCVRAVRDAIDMDDGDVVVTNHPAFGGSHLPDVTVIAPVFVAAGASKQLIGYVANRAHHAEIGGVRPGSMPPDARTLAEEGVVIPPMHLVRRGRARFAEAERLLRGGPHPSRAIEDNLADLHAAVAACHRGAQALRELAAAHGADVVIQQMQAVNARAERLAREALRMLPQRRSVAIERLDDGSPIQVAIDLTSDHAVIDFAGTAPRHPGNLNATPAIVRSAVIYVLLTMLRSTGITAGERLPMNEGIMRAVELRIPQGILNPTFTDGPAQSPAVVGGNVETSQRIVDALLKAFGLCACSQGTMNNTLFGNERFGYYETVCGGCGAGPGFDGASAVHSHMTNTRITDPEIIEHRYPVRLERFGIRRGSGGGGAFRGGDGAVREITFLQPMSLSMLTQHRVERPYGMRGGESGAPGRQRVIRSTGEVIDLHSVDGCEVRPGDRLVLETPGGGGWG